MSQWLKFPKRTYQAAITGKVVDGQTRHPVGGVTVKLTAMPPAFERRLALQALQHGAAWETLAERPDRTRTADDGGFCFTDLPDGAYTLAFTLPRSKHRYGSVSQSFTVTRDAGGRIPFSPAVVPLPPTGVRGRVQGLVQGEPTALPLALIRVQGSGESVHGDAQGRFYLTGVETGERELRFSAQGFKPTTARVPIAEGTVVELSSIVLHPFTP
jgi:Carboxypeptidase regulatory-like domain/CarboxypepD_reg-like domain